MSTHMMTEAVGYIGSAIVLVSFLMTSVLRLRVVNTAGSIIFMIYAIIIHTYPTALMNLCLALINIRFLWKMRHTGREYELVRLDPEDDFLQYTLRRQYSEIKHFFPEIKLSPQEGKVSDAIQSEAGKKTDTCYMVTCQGAPAGIAIGSLVLTDEDKVFYMLMDYSLPEYRDFSLGLFLAEALKKEGFTKMIYDGPAEHHMDYLNKMAFVEDNGVYVKRL